MVSCHKGNDRLVTLQMCNIQLSELAASARDRDVWRTLCEAGLSDFMNGWASTSMKRRAARHAATAKPKAGPRCPHSTESVPRSSDYGVIFGFTQLITPTVCSSATSSSISTDFSSR